MKFRVSRLTSTLLLTLLVGACASPSTQQSTTKESIVNQLEDASSEARFSQNLQQVLNQVACVARNSQLVASFNSVAYF